MPMEKMFKILEKGGEADNLNDTPREAPPEAEEEDKLNEPPSEATSEAEEAANQPVAEEAVNPYEASDSHIEYVFTEKRFVAYFYQIIC